jgi:hypothetical protein
VVAVSGYTIAWLAWLGAFVVIEGRALTNKASEDTLSEHVWRWFAVRDKSRKGLIRARRFALLAFMAWLSAHFLTGGRF